MLKATEVWVCCLEEWLRLGLEVVIQAMGIEEETKALSVG